MTETDGQRTVRALKEDFTADFVDVDFRNGVVAVLRSPLLSQGPVLVASEKLALGESTGVAKKILDSFEVLTSLKKLSMTARR